MESKQTRWIALILALSIIGQAVSYMAVERILDRVLGSQTQVVVTVSENASAPSETQVIGQIPTQKIEVTETPTEETQTEFGAFVEEYKPFGVLNAASGVNWFNGQKETYYNLPMQGVVNIAQSRGIEGDYWEREDGCKMYGDYIIVAAHQGIHPYGSIVETSLGEGIVLDTGSFINANPTQVDIAVTW